MATEIARIDVKSGEAEAFLAAAEQAVPLFRAAEGCLAMRIGRSHEHPDRFWLFVEWTDVAAHEAFRQTDLFTRWRALVGPYIAAPPEVEHALPAVAGFGSDGA